MVEHRVTLFRIGAFLLFFSIALLFAAAFCFLAVGEYLFLDFHPLCRMPHGGLWTLPSGIATYQSFHRSVQQGFRA